jgi:hypothetical protein
MVAAGELAKGAEVFVFTDNMVLNVPTLEGHQKLEVASTDTRI